MLLKLLLLTLLLLSDTINGSITIDYYENLINAKMSEAQTYELPHRNEEFRAGINSDIIKSFGIYDFIVVGAGSSGSVLATRLSEIDDFSILLLEAGGEEDDFSVIPSAFPYLQFSEMNWGYFSTPQTNCCLGMINQQCIVPRGKVVGGSSSINAMMYVRGNPADYNIWEALGNPGWSYDDVMPYFLKSENSQINGDPCFHGKGGFWNVEYAQPASPIVSHFFKASLDDNVNNKIADYNGKNQIGISQIQFSTKNGRRHSTGTAFLSNARKRKNLKIVTKALATKIIIDPDSKEAQGIEFVTNDQTFHAFAKKEVIVSGGAINSPQLLMLSGIGPKEHLEEIGIDVVADLPVGKNLIEHPLYTGMVFHSNYTSRDISLEEQIQSYLDGFGPLSKPSSIESIGFMPSKNQTLEIPSIEFIYLRAKGGLELPLAKLYNYNDALISNFLAKINPDTDFMIILLLLHQKSRGQITLKSSNPIDFPDINLNMLSEFDDVKSIIEGINFVRKLTKTKAFQQINAELIDITLCSEFAKYSDDYWECMIRQLTTTLYHPCGTTAMGSDPAISVVDSNLKVHGIDRLRVVDAGVFPFSISGHTNAPAVMIAEKIADVIKADCEF